MSSNQRATILGRHRLRLGIGAALVLGPCLGATGCAWLPAEAPPAPPTPVAVSYPVEREVTDYADFTSRIARCISPSASFSTVYVEPFSFANLYFSTNAATPCPLRYFATSYPS